jgi:cyclopropane fatty-acyl-phospholipid synthase-like methyltransferase
MVNYDQVYGDNPEYFGSEASSLLEKFAQHVPARARILDIGVGQGRNCLPLARRGCQVTGIDNSGVAIETVREQAGKENLSVKLWQGNYLDYEPTEAPFDVVLCFGLLQTLDRSQGASLIHRLRVWIRPGGMVFVTAWHIGDSSYTEVSKSWDMIGLNSFQSREGECRTYLEMGEILQIFKGWEIIHHWEGLGPEHRHGNGPPESHGTVELVAARR